MLQPMSSIAHLAEANTRMRSCEGRASGDVHSETSSEATEETELPECKIKRNYTCMKCSFYTQNPRAYLIHMREVHFVKMKIYECPQCTYASKQLQKLIRHMKMVHGKSSLVQANKMDSDANNECETTAEGTERIEDLLEEIEECDDSEVKDYEEESMEAVDDVDGTGVEYGKMLSDKKLKFFSCDKCTYVTHKRGRFTKHIKYHSMPMIKCTICDFRSPYKWNLDRHMRNHEGSGKFTCFACNFTSDIKQSLTVHELNHHTPPTSQSNMSLSRRRTRVGASDVVFSEETGENKGSGGSVSSNETSDMGVQHADIEMVDYSSDSNDAITSDIVAKKDEPQLAQDVQSQLSPNSITDEAKGDVYKQNRKMSRPIPQLIPLNSSTPSQKSSPGEPPMKKFKENSNNDSDMDCQESNLSAEICSNGTITNETGSRKKNESFFDKLKERLLTETGEEGALVCKNCGLESKCLSKHSVHEKNCMALSNRSSNSLLSSSTRCQHCRHRCKSSADLYIHMQTCRKKENKVDEKLPQAKDDDNSDMTASNPEPHPMENVVFVWNNINQDTNKFDVPLDININDDCTLPGPNRSFDIEPADENESMNLSPSQAVGKKVFKCPHCQFWASTASRFHVHIVGHLNKKPFECSLCKYKSNWRWDITKHIKLKSARDKEHNNAKVLMTDETGRRNYSKYFKFLAVPILSESGQTKLHYVNQNTSVDPSVEADEYHGDEGSTHEMQPLNLQTQNYFQSENTNNSNKPKKTLWKCKKCNYKDPSKEALLEHVREHSIPEESDDMKNKKIDGIDIADLAYRCGHCHQLSNWKHVIQRHCRLKHGGIVKVITTTRPKFDPNSIHAQNDMNGENCLKCPFKTDDKKLLSAHMQQHEPSMQSIFKCFFCPYFVKSIEDLTQHLVLHGITDPEEYIGKSVAGDDSLLSDPNMSFSKRHKCTECPYETNSKSQFTYHEQFHRLPADTPYKCPECNYSVSKRHLLHQHMRVHGITPKKGEFDQEFDAMTSTSTKPDNKDLFPFLDEIPCFWVSARNEFHKMYKCRYCSYVNAQRCKIPNHEKIHCVVFGKSKMVLYKCLECKFTSDYPNRLAEHSKGHGQIYGRIYCRVEPDVPDEEQIAKLREIIEHEKLNPTEDSVKEENPTKDNEEFKTLYFCQKCPARYFSSSELKVHCKFHELSFIHKCKYCEYSVPGEEELMVHEFVHSDDYHTKTNLLNFMHKAHPAFEQPTVETSQFSNDSETTWVISNRGKNSGGVDTHKRNENKHVPKQYLCKECPAKFLKNSALTYHVGLHGGEGDHRCRKCNYTVKNVGNLAKHELLHENEGKTPGCDYESGDDGDYKNIPLSGTDLFQRKTEAQKRVLTDKDKLVKPNDHFPPVLQADPQFGYLIHGNPEFIYPTYLKNGRQKEKRYKCHKCPSAFEKREQYKIHLSLHGSKQRYHCQLCDYSVKYYANYVQHMRKHQMNDEAQAERKKENNEYSEADTSGKQLDSPENVKLAIKSMPRGPPKSDFQQFSVSDQQTLRILQRRRSTEKDTTTETSPTKDRKLNMCVLCPYTNQRQDALRTHYRRHEDAETLNLGSHKCTYCDLVIAQSHFLRDHLKTHFNYQKTLNPDCFVANEGVSFVITKIEGDDVPTDLKLEAQDKNRCNDEKTFVNITTGEILVE